MTFQTTLDVKNKQHCFDSSFATALYISRKRKFLINGNPGKSIHFHIRQYTNTAQSLHTAIYLSQEIWLTFAAMILIDTHTHLYLEHFKDDRHQVVKNAIEKGVKFMLLPNIDQESIEGMLEVCDTFPGNCFPMVGLHPVSVTESYKKELKIINIWLQKRKFVAIGEIGMDLYWDKSFKKEQEAAFRCQIELAIQHKLPVAIHSRNAMPEICNILTEFNEHNLKGVFHCFSGTLKEAEKIITMGFSIGIGGVITFKDNHLTEIIKHIDLKYILLETDAPYLSPVPHRGKRNESSFILYITEKIGEIKKIPAAKVAETTSNNARELFQI